MYNPWHASEPRFPLFVTIAYLAQFMLGFAAVGHHYKMSPIGMPAFTFIHTCILPRSLWSLLESWYVMYYVQPRALSTDYILDFRWPNRIWSYQGCAYSLVINSSVVWDIQCPQSTQRPTVILTIDTGFIESQESQSHLASRRLDAFPTMHRLHIYV